MMAAAGAMAMAATAAHADPISMYYSLDGSNFFQLGTTTTTGANSYGSSIIPTTNFQVTFTATGSGPGSFLQEPYFNTTTATITNSGPGTIYLAALETGISNTNVGNFTVSFGGNGGNPGTITESFYVGTSLSLSSAASPLLSYTLFADTAPTTLSANAPSLSDPYQVAELYKIVFTQSGTIQGTIQEQASVPEPMSLSLLGAGLVGLGFIRRRAGKSA